MGNKAKRYISLLRVKHYLKNFLIFVPAFFGGEIFQINTLVKLICSFAAFSIGASFIYIINDIKDYEQDRLHEEKKYRPIASGVISRKEAWIIGIILLLLAVTFLVAIQEYDGLIFLLVYIGINILYSVGLKKLPIVDVIILASGFVIRVLFGAAVGDIVCSGWLILTIMSVSLYLGLGKRRNERVKVSNGETREVLKKYSIEYLDTMMRMCMTIGVVFYSLWSMDIGGTTQKNFFIWTIPIVIVLIMRYEMDIESNSYGDPIEVIYKDKILLLIGMFYIIVMLIGKYVF